MHATRVLPARVAFFQSKIENRKSKMQVALFITCLTDQFYPHVGIAVTKILEHFGCTVSFPSAQTCCGQPSLNNGCQGEARVLGRRMSKSFEHCDYSVSACGCCCRMVREQSV